MLLLTCETPRGEHTQQAVTNACPCHHARNCGQYVQTSFVQEYGRKDKTTRVRLARRKLTALSARSRDQHEHHRHQQQGLRQDPENFPGYETHRRSFRAGEPANESVGQIYIWERTGIGNGWILGPRTLRAQDILQTGWGHF